MATKLGKIVADFTTQLATALAIGATTATLQSATDDDGNALPAGRYFFAIDGTNSSKEHISCDLSGTSLTNIKTLSRQGAEVAGVIRAHRIGATVTLTDFAHIKFINDLLSGATDLDASNPLEYDAAPSILNDNQLATKKYVDDIAIAGGADASTTVKGISKLSVAPVSPTDPIAAGTNDTRIPSQGENDALVGTSGTPSSTNKYVTNDDTTGSGAVLRASAVPSVKFGGTGADGALTISSGTTTIDCAGAAVVTKNYTSISITGTAQLAFSNPHANGTVIILKSQGAVTITTSGNPAIDLRNLGSTAGGATAQGGTQGAAGGGGGASAVTNGSGGQNASAAGNQNAGTDGTDAIGVIKIKGGVAPIGNSATAGIGGVTVGGSLTGAVAGKAILLVPGSGGASGGGGQSSGAGGAGGRGAGSLYVECAGALNISSVINAAGTAGSAAGTNGGGGGGGGAGVIIILYTTLTSNTGTYTVTGGAAGAGGAAAGGAGGAGASLVAVNTEFL